MCSDNSFEDRKKEVEYCLILKDYFVKKLKEKKIIFEHNPNNGLSIYFKKENVDDVLINKYHLVSNEEYTHIYIMVHLTTELLDEFIYDYLNL